MEVPVMPQPIPTFIERQDRQRTDSLSTIDSVLSRCADEDRDPTEVEEATLTDARTRLERADAFTTEYGGLLETRARQDEERSRWQGAVARSQVSRPGSALAVPDPEAELGRLFRSPADYVSTFVGARLGDQSAQQRMQRAVDDQLLADNLGIVPTPIVGPVVSLIARSRPTVASANNRPLPQGGRSFTRPYVSQHTAVGQQTVEKTELASQKMLIDPINVNKMTYGGTLDISFQDRDWTDPAILQIVIDDMALVYGKMTDAGFATAFVAAVTATQAYTPPVAPETDGGALIDAIAGASAKVFAATNEMPDTLWVSPDMWQVLASKTDTTGRPLFSSVGPMNSGGSISPTSLTGNVYGLTLVVDVNLGAGVAIIGVARFAEFYEQVGGQLSVTEPTILGFVVAYYGYVAWCFPAPTAFCKITGVVTRGGNGSGTQSATK